MGKKSNWAWNEQKTEEQHLGLQFVSVISCIQAGRNKFTCVQAIVIKKSSECKKNNRQLYQNQSKTTIKMLHFINKIIPANTKFLSLFHFKQIYVFLSFLYILTSIYSFGILSIFSENDSGRNFHLWFIYQFRYNWAYGWQHRLGAFKLLACSGPCRRISIGCN